MYKHFDLTRETDTINNLRSIVRDAKEAAPTTEIVISSLSPRHDKANINQKVIQLNKEICCLAKDMNITVITHPNLDKSSLSKNTATFKSKRKCNTRKELLRVHSKEFLKKETIPELVSTSQVIKNRTANNQQKAQSRNLNYIESIASLDCINDNSISLHRTPNRVQELRL